MKKKMQFLSKMIKQEGLFFFLAVLARSVDLWLRKNILGQAWAIKKINNMYLMRLNLKEGGIDKALYLFRTREELETEAVKRCVGSGMTILDLGANIGYYTLLLANLVGEKGKIYAVEPLPSNFERLKENLALNKQNSKVEVENAAISDFSGEMDFFIGAKHNLGTLVDIGREGGKGKIKAKTYSLADFLAHKPKIGLIRMDIERGELAVFKNIIEEWPKRGFAYPEKIMFEVHPEGSSDPDPDFTPLLNKLSEIGYYAQYAIGSSLPLSAEKYKELGYSPEKTTYRGHALYKDIKKEHLVEIAARRPKITRAIMLSFKP